MTNKIHSSPRARAKAFTDRLGIQLPILLAPMGGRAPHPSQLLLQMLEGWERAGLC
jgi:hypothetical protein